MTSHSSGLAGERGAAVAAGGGPGDGPAVDTNDLTDDDVVTGSDLAATATGALGPSTPHPDNEEEISVPTDHSPADDIVFDLISVQFHALEAAQVSDKYIEDAHDHEDVRQFFEEIAQQDAQRAQRCHEFLGKLTSRHGLRGT